MYFQTFGRKVSMFDDTIGMHQAILERCYKTLARRCHSCSGVRQTLRIVVGMRVQIFAFRALHHGSQVSGRHTTEGTHRRAIDSS